MWRNIPYQLDSKNFYHLTLVIILRVQYLIHKGATARDATNNADMQPNFSVHLALAFEFCEEPLSLRPSPARLEKLRTTPPGVWDHKYNFSIFEHVNVINPMLTVVLCLANRLGLHNYRAEVGEGLDGDAVAVLEPHKTPRYSRDCSFSLTIIMAQGPQAVHKEPFNRNHLQCH